jgi:hypothetical protein
MDKNKIYTAVTEKDLKHWSWAKSHACVPTVLEFDTFYRLYFSPRNEFGKSIPVYVDLSLNTLEIINYGEQIIDLGEIGTFDDGGIMPCSVLRVDDKVYLYYVGWNPSVSVPYRNSIGVCVSYDEGKTFHRIYKGPIVDRNITEPFFTASPCIIKDNNIFKMWYASSTGFIEVGGDYSPLYHIKYAESKDGFIWDRKNISCILPKYEGECTAKPTIIVEDSLYKMWYCYRGSLDYRGGKDSYQIGYAESNNGIDWERLDDKIKIPITEKNNNMNCYPNVLNRGDHKIMFFNGNDFGKQGIEYFLL